MRKEMGARKEEVDGRKGRGVGEENGTERGEKWVRGKVRLGKDHRRGDCGKGKGKGGREKMDLEKGRQGGEVRESVGMKAIG